MEDYIEKRVLELAEWVASSGKTVREAGKHFAVSKSTVHKDLRERLPKIDGKLYERVAKVLELNKDERHIRGGQATKRKWTK